MRLQLRVDVFLGAVQRIVRVGLGDVFEDLHDAGQRGAGAFHGHDGVVEIGCGGVGGDALDLGGMLAHRRLDGGRVIGIVDAVEGRRVVGQVARRQQRVVWRRGLRGVEAAQHEGGGEHGFCQGSGGHADCPRVPAM